MILIAVPGEGKDEKRVALSPETAKKFIAKGCEVVIEKGAGLRADMTDKDYEEAGARISSTIAKELGKADIVLAVNCPASESIKTIKKARPSQPLLIPLMISTK